MPYQAGVRDCQISPPISPVPRQGAEYRVGLQPKSWFPVGQSEQAMRLLTPSQPGSELKSWRTCTSCSPAPVHPRGRKSTDAATASATASEATPARAGEELLIGSLLRKT